MFVFDERKREIFLFICVFFLKDINFVRWGNVFDSIILLLGILIFFFEVFNFFNNSS